MFLKKFLFLIICIWPAHVCFAQKEQWPEEVSRLYLQARDYLANNKLQQAIISYKEAINLMPANMLLYRDLAKAYYSAHLYEDAEQTLKPLLKSKDADEQCYQVMAMSQTAEKEDKKARHTLEEGLKKFPRSGLLQHELGKWYEEANEPEAALSQWLEGIAEAPGYYLNYYEAATMYSHTEYPIWTILYGETFVNMEHETPRSYEVRKLMLEAYRKLYSGILTESPEYGSKVNKATDFESAVKDVYRKLAPVVKDGINLQSLETLRRQFLTGWNATYAAKYPYTLFLYEDELVKGDYFDVYNKWLFGKLLNEPEWKTEQSAFEALGNWTSSHALQPKQRDFYGNKHVKRLFPKPKQ